MFQSELHKLQVAVGVFNVNVITGVPACGTVIYKFLLEHFEHALLRVWLLMLWINETEIPGCEHDQEY